VNLRSQTLTLWLAEDASLSNPESGTLEVTRSDRLFRLKLLDPGVVAALSRLADGPATLDELEKIALTTHADADLARLGEELRRLGSKLLLRLGCVVAGTPLLRATVRTDLYDVDAARMPADVPVRLSRFAWAHRVGERLVLDSPASYAQIEFLAAGLAGPVLTLTQPRTVAALCAEAAGYEAPAVAAAIEFLHALGVVYRVDEAGRTPDETRPELVQREVHDLVLHAASRYGLIDKPLGGTFRFRGTLPPTPARKTPPEGPRIALPRTDLDRLADTDPPLVQVMESRVSIREHGTDPITLEQVAEFLYRVARVKSFFQIDESAGMLYESTRRTYPSGGATYDLEFYLTVRSCAGLDPGVYHYDPFEHELTLICVRDDLIRQVVQDAFRAAGGHGVPQIVITLASRFHRLSWKYEGIAYAVTLKNVGVVYHAMYLVAMAMGLAPCALGAGDAATFAAITGLDPVVESSVGEFMLGSR
jgi:SagB-type dehydrogenase family enzyme